jgi:hypothetical protein
MSGHKLLHAAAAIAFSVGLSGAALAQGTPVQPQPRDPNMPAPHNTVPEKIEPNSTSSTGGTLSDKLERSGGVITPPSGVDPGISTAAPVPHPGTTPVIPPPGSPGGNQSVQPK